MAAGGKRPGAGRPKGSKGKATLAVQEKLDALGCDPIEGMARIALGAIPCNTCGESGQITKAQMYQMCGLNPPKSALESDEGMIEFTNGVVTCPICGGTTIEQTTTKLRSEMYKELAQYVAPKRKAIEHSGDGLPVLIRRHLGEKE